MEIETDLEHKEVIEKLPDQIGVFNVQGMRAGCTTKIQIEEKANSNASPIL